MRLASVLLLLAAYPSTVSVGCAPAPKRPEAGSITKLELHSWAERRRKGLQYWVTTVEVETGCVSSETLDDGILQIVRDCSFAALIRPRVDELIAVFEETEQPQVVGERVAEEGEGHAAVFVFGDGTRWTVDSKLLREGAELLDHDTSEWLLIGTAPNELPPSPEGWTQLDLRDQKGVLERQLASDGRWSCESWVVSEQTLEHFIIIRRGRIEAARAAELLDGFAEGLAPVLAGAAEEPWTATLAPEDQSAAIKLQGDELVARWDAFSADLDPDCVLDPPPTAAGL
jgi:hypothetical protein